MSATSKQALPQTLDELKALSFDNRARLWPKYSPHPFKRQMRALWHYVQCDQLGLRIEQKYITKIKKYKDNPSECMTRAQRHKYNLPPGASTTACRGLPAESPGLRYRAQISLG